MHFEPVAPGVYPPAVHPAYQSSIKRGPQQAPLRVRASAAAERSLHFAPALLGSKDVDLTALRGQIDAAALQASVDPLQAGIWPAALARERAAALRATLSTLPAAPWPAASN